MLYDDAPSTLHEQLWAKKIQCIFSSCGRSIHVLFVYRAKKHITFLLHYMHVGTLLLV